MTPNVAAMADVVNKLLDENRVSGYDPWLPVYCGSLRESGNLVKYLRHLEYMFDLAGVETRGLRVLDAGCGFGLTCVACYFLGAREVHGVDAYQGMISTFQSYIAEFMPRSPIYPKVSDVAKMTYADGVFDAVLAVEAISHFHDLPRFFQEAHRVLRVGGALLISDGNNPCNPLIKHKTRRIWDSFEKGDPVAHASDGSVRKPFVVLRQEIIERSFPDLSRASVQELARRTFGMTEEQVIVACRRFLRDGLMPEQRDQSRDCPLDPIGHVYIERLLNPFDLRRQLDDAGFETRAYAYLGGARGGITGLLDQALRPLGRLLIYAATGYKIVAVKRA